MVARYGIPVREQRFPSGGWKRVATYSDPDTLFPCPEEVARMETVRSVFHLHPTPDIWEATVRAADIWNDALGRVVFSVALKAP